MVLLALSVTSFTLAQEAGQKMRTQIFWWQEGQRICFGCWNMITLLEADGPVETAVARKSCRGVTVDRKVAQDFMCAMV